MTNVFIVPVIPDSVLRKGDDWSDDNDIDEILEVEIVVVNSL